MNNCFIFSTISLDPPSILILYALFCKPRPVDKINTNRVPSGHSSHGPLKYLINNLFYKCAQAPEHMPPTLLPPLGGPVDTYTNFFLHWFRICLSRYHRYYAECIGLGLLSFYFFPNSSWIFWYTPFSRSFSLCRSILRERSCAISSVWLPTSRYWHTNYK